MEKLSGKWVLSESLRRFLPGQVAQTLSMMFLWSRLPKSMLKEIPALQDASPEFILNSSDEIEKRLCPELGIEIGRQWRQLGASDIEIVRRAVMNALSGSLSTDEIAEAILEYCAPEAWGSEENSNTLLAALDAKKGTRIRCAFSYGLHAAWVLSKQARVELDVESHDLATIISILAKACDRPLIARVISINAIADNNEPEKGDFDHALILPPLGMRLKVNAWSKRQFGSAVGDQMSAEAFGSLWGAHLGRKRNVVVVGNGLLFRTSSTDAAMKQELIQHHGLEAVVSLPRGAMPGSAVAMSAVVFSGEKRPKNHAGTIRFINASEPALLDFGTLSELLICQKTHPLCVDCTIQEVFETGFNLSVDRYVLDQEARHKLELLKGRETVKLSDLADISRPQAFPREAEVENGFLVREVMLADIDNGHLSLPAKLSELPQSARTKIENAVLRPGDILLSIKGTIGKIALVTEDVILESNPASVVPGQSLVIIRMRKGGSIRQPEVLVGYLRSPLGQSLLQRMAGGTTIANVAMGDLKSMSVPVLPMEEQQIIVAKYIEHENIRKRIAEWTEEMKKTEESIFNITLGEKFGINVQQKIR